MNTRARRGLVIPTTLAVTVTVVGLGLGLACAPTSTSADGACDPVAIKDAGVVTYQCRDGRTCEPPDPTAIDGGVYQVCPGAPDCTTLVTYEGQASFGLC